MKVLDKNGKIIRDTLPQSFVGCDTYVQPVGRGELCIDGDLNATQLRELGAWLLEHEAELVR